MRQCNNLKEKIFNIGINGLFYIMLFILILWIIYPYTSFYYKRPIIQPFAMRLNVTSIELEVGESYRIYVVGIKRKAKFSTNDFKILEVRSNGYIRARQKGKAVVKVKVGKKTLKCKVTVVKKK